VTDDGGRLRCPFCEGYEVDRLFLASLGLDACACGSCGARWDEKVATGEFAGRGSSASVVSRRSTS
jgi:hypothetical protein